MTHASLFSGIGGFDLAAEWAGWTNAFNCEIDPFCQIILKYHFPDAKQYGDIKTTDFTIWRDRIDVLTGGFPCQPFSLAGKRKGTEDDRYLWPEMQRVIRTVRPRWVVGENVYGIVNWSKGMVFDKVCTDLETAGYEVQPYIIPACGVGAPHRRDRVWFVAYKEPGTGRCGTTAAVVAHHPNSRDQAVQAREDSIHAAGVAADPDVPGCRYRPNQPVALAGSCGTSHACTGCKEWVAADTYNERCGQLNDSSIAGSTRQFGRSIPTGVTADLHGHGRSPDSRAPGSFSGGNTRNDEYDKCLQIHRDDIPGQNYTRFNIPEWKDFPTQSPICSRDDGISLHLDNITFSRWRNLSLKAYGNAIVPQVALQIFRTINDFEGRK